MAARNLCQAWLFSRRRAGRNRGAAGLIVPISTAIGGRQRPSRPPWPARLAPHVDQTQRPLPQGGRGSQSPLAINRG
jgi:hypothetical protein